MQLTIDGSAIRDIPTFYDEINRVFMSGEDWRIGNSLDALDDLLYGGFGIAKDAKKLEISWLHIGQTRDALGYEETKKYYQSKLEPGSPFNKSLFAERLAELENGTGKTYFDLVMEIFDSHAYISIH